MLPLSLVQLSPLPQEVTPATCQPPWWSVIAGPPESPWQVLWLAPVYSRNWLSQLVTGMSTSRLVPESSPL